MTYFIVPILILVFIGFLLYIAIKEIPQLSLFAIVLILPLALYLSEKSYESKVYETTDYSILCDEYVCILRIDDRNITYKYKKDYDLIKSNKFVVEVEEYFGIFGNPISKDYQIKPLTNLHMSN